MQTITCATCYGRQDRSSFRIGESRKELAVERDHLVYAIEQELGRLEKDGVLTFFLAILGVGSVLRKYTFCSGGMTNGVHT